VKSYRKELTFHIPKRIGFVNVTPEVEAAIRESGISEGSASSTRCTSPRRSSSTTTSGAPRRLRALLRAARSARAGPAWRHNDTGEENADAHVKRQLMGREAVLAVTGGRLDLGPWEQVFYGEWDGRRAKRVLIKIIGE
jgi:conserved hypothetical protein TIGR00149